MPETFSLLQDSIVTDLAIAFAGHPWVAEVQSVTKRPGGVVVRLVYRRPTLMVQTSRGVYPIDDTGVLLPPTDFSAADAKTFPRLEGVRSTPQGPAGQPWGDPAVAGGARLAAELTRDRHGETAWGRYGLKTIVVLSPKESSGSEETDLYGLKTETGSRIVWGHAPGEDALEPTVEQKLKRLDSFLADNGSFESMPEPVVIDVHDWELIHWGVLSRGNSDSSVPR